MINFNLTDSFNNYKNPWMEKSYRNLNSCLRTIEHMRQTWKYGCWNNRDDKTNCNNIECEYHPTITNIKNPCNLKRGVVWKRIHSKHPFEYGDNYLAVIFREILKGKKLSLKKSIKLFYPNNEIDEKSVSILRQEFYFSDIEYSKLI